jgi:hypothetical protein
MLFSTHPNRPTQAIEALAPICVLLYLLFSILTTRRLRSILSSTQITPSPLLILCNQIIKCSQRQLTPLAILTWWFYIYLANSSQRLTKPVNICG